MPLGWIFGPGRVGFILAIVNTYAMPAFVVLLLANRFLSSRLRRPGSAGEASIRTVWVSAAALAFFAPFWISTLWGYPDVGGVIFVSLVLILHWRKPWSERNPAELFALGVSLAGAVLFRRWYAYWAVAFFAVAFFEEILTIWTNRTRGVPIAWKGLAKLAASGLISLATFGLLAGPMVRRMFLTNYAFLYSYMRSDLATSLTALVGRIGILHIVVFFAGAWLAVVRPASRSRALFCLSQLLFILVMFLRTQDFDAHHVYLLLPGVMLMIFVAMTNLFGRGAGPLKVGVGMAYLLLSAVSCAAVFLPVLPRVPFLFPRAHAPLVRTDLPEIRRLFDVLEAQGGSVYVLAASEVLNSSLLKAAPMSIDVPAAVADRIFWTRDVDKRDGFPVDLPRADLLIVATPVQTLGKPCEQRGIVLPAREMLEGRGIARHYERLPGEFDLQGSVRAMVYRRRSEISAEEIDALRRAMSEPCR